MRRKGDFHGVAYEIPILQCLLEELQGYQNLRTNSKSHKNQKLREEMDKGQKSEDPKPFPFPETVDTGTDQ